MLSIRTRFVKVLFDTQFFEQFLELVHILDENVASFGTFVGSNYSGCFELVGQFAGTVVSYLEGTLET